jgi:hypothetical protein
MTMEFQIACRLPSGAANVKNRMGRANGPPSATSRRNLPLFSDFKISGQAPGLRKHPDAKAGNIPIHANPDLTEISYLEGVASNTFFEVLLERLHMEKSEPQRLAPSL